MANNETSTDLRPLRVLCCSGSLEGGGSERQLWQLATQLNRQQFSPSVYLLYRRGHYIDQLPSDVPVTAFWDAYDESQSFWPGQIRRLQIAHLTQIIREQQIDVIYDRTFHMTLITAAAASQAKVPRVSVIVSPPSADFQKSRERFRFLKKRLLAKAYRQSDCVTIAVSDEVADDASAFYGLARANVIVLPNPVDVEAVRHASGISLNPTHLSDSTSRPEDELRIAVVGRLSPEKGQRLALQALQIVNAGRNLPIHMDLVGDGPDRVQLERLAAELGVSQHVTFHGFLSNPYPLMRAANLVCIPSEHEGLPNVALEAMVLGTGVVATNCSGSLRSLVGVDTSARAETTNHPSNKIMSGPRGTLVANNDPRTMAEAFHSLTTEPDTWSRRRTAAREWVESQHAIAPWLDKIGNILANRR